MLVVTLNRPEYSAAASLGVKREALRRSRGKAQDFDKRGDRGGSMDERNAIGAVAEYALAKHYGADLIRDWCENKAFSYEHERITADVGRTIQVRASANPKATLWLYSHDRYPDAPFALAIVTNLTITFPGWVYGREGQVPEFWDRLGWSRFGPDRAAFNVPSQILKPIEAIPNVCIR